MRGTVIKRGKKWAVVLDLGNDSDGKRRREWHSGYSSRKDAEAARAELVSSYNKGVHVSPSKLSVADWCRQWLVGLPAEGLGRNTIESYRVNVEAHIIPRLGYYQLQRLTPATIKGFYSALLEGGRRDGSGGLAPRTVQYVGVVLGRALEDAVRQTVIQANPARGIRKPRPAAPTMKTWTAAQLRHFLEHVSADRLYSLWLMAASTGMRRSEVLGLRWEDLDLSACRVATRQVVVLVDHQPVIKAANKTAASTRLIALDTATVEALREHRKQQLEERLAWGPAWVDSGLIFTLESGAPIHPERMTRWFEAHARASGLPLIRLHDLRHTHATLALQAGVHAKVVQERLGHSSISITLDTYSHAIPAMQEDAAERVANLVFGR